MKCALKDIQDYYHEVNYHKENLTGYNGASKDYYGITISHILSNPKHFAKCFSFCEIYNLEKLHY